MIENRAWVSNFVYITCVIQCVKAIFGPNRVVKFEIPDQKFGMGEPEPVLSTLL